MGNNLPIISELLRRFEEREVAAFQDQPLRWRFAVEVEYSLDAANTKQVASKIEKIRTERLHFRQQELSHTDDEQKIKLIENEMDQLLNSPDFNVTAKDGKHRAAQVLENLAHCEVNDVCRAQGMIRRRFGTGEYSAGWFDAARVGEVASDGGRDAAQVIEEHSQILSIIKEVGAKYALETGIGSTHLNFSLSIEENGRLRHLVEVGTPEALDLYGRALAGISKAFVDAEPLMNLLKKDSFTSAYKISCNAGTHRGGCDLRNSQYCSEHRSLGIEPDLEEAITLVIGGAAQALAADDATFTGLGLKKGEIVDVPVYEDNTGKNVMLKGVVKSMQPDKATGKLSINANYYNMFLQLIIGDIFNGFKELPARSRTQGLARSTALFFYGLRLKEDGTIDIERQRQTIAALPQIPGLLKMHYAEKVLAGLQSLTKVGSYKSVRHEGYPTEFGGANTKQRLRDMAASPALKGIYGRDILKQKVLLASGQRDKATFRPSP